MAAAGETVPLDENCERVYRRIVARKRETERRREREEEEDSTATPEQPSKGRRRVKPTRFARTVSRTATERRGEREKGRARWMVAVSATKDAERCLFATSAWIVIIVFWYGSSWPRDFKVSHAILARFFQRQ